MNRGFLVSVEKEGSDTMTGSAGNMMSTDLSRRCLWVVLIALVVTSAIRLSHSIHASRNGWSMIRSRNNEEAARQFKKAVRFEPSLAEAHYGLSLALSVMGDDQGARAEFARAYDTDVRMTEAKFRALNENLFTKGMWNTVVRRLLDKEYKRSGGSLYLFADTNQMHNLGCAFGNFGRSDLAVRYLSECVKRSPKNPEHLYMLGVAYRDEDDVTRALEWFSKALSLDSSNPDILFMKADVEAVLDRNADAEKDYERVTQLVPASPMPWLRLGKILERLGNIEDAARCFRKSINANPDYLDAYVALARIRGAEKGLSSMDGSVLESLKHLKPTNPISTQLSLGAKLTGFNVHFPRGAYEKFYSVTFWNLSGDVAKAPLVKQNSDVTVIRIGERMLVMDKKNLVLNGGFEEDVPQIGLPSKWEKDRYNAPPGTHKIVERSISSGGKVFSLDHNGHTRKSSCVSAHFNVLPGKAYLLSGIVESRGGRGYLGYAWFDHDGNQLTYGYVARDVQGTSERALCFGVIHSPETAVSCEIWLFNYDGAGTVIFDNISFLELNLTGRVL